MGWSKTRPVCGGNKERDRSRAILASEPYPGFHSISLARQRTPPAHRRRVPGDVQEPAWLSGRPSHPAGVAPAICRSRSAPRQKSGRPLRCFRLPSHAAQTGDDRAPGDQSQAADKCSVRGADLASASPCQAEGARRFNPRKHDAPAVRPSPAQDLAADSLRQYCPHCNVKRFYLKQPLSRALVNSDVVAPRRTDVELARTADLLTWILDHFLPLRDPAGGARHRE